MKLLEFITYCKVSGLITHQLQIDDYLCKVIIERGDVRLDMLYQINKLGQASIIESALYRAKFPEELSPSFATILEVFFPNDIT